MTRCVRQTVTLASASSNNIALSQTPTAAAGFTINGSAASGGVATLDVQRRVLLTTTANESSKTVTLTGTDGQGNTISEVLAGVNATTTYSKLDYKTVVSVVPSANFAGAATLGTNGVASTPWIPLDSNRVGTAWSLGVILGTTANVMPQGTLDPLLPAEYGNWTGQTTDSSSWVPPTAFDLQTAAMTATNLVYGTFPLHAVRLLINSGATSAGTVFEVVQQGDI